MVVFSQSLRSLTYWCGNDWQCFAAYCLQAASKNSGFVSSDSESDEETEHGGEIAQLKHTLNIALGGKTSKLHGLETAAAVVEPVPSVASAGAQVC